MPASPSSLFVKIAIGAVCAAILVGLLVLEQPGSLSPGGSLTAANDDAARVLPTTTLDNPKSAGELQTAVLAGGCFWGVQGVFEHVNGVRKVIAGYSGSSKAAAQYSLVSTGLTGHAESAEITFDPQQISYGEILRIFFSLAHNPTQLNFQGPDIGTQYRSEIFYSDPSQQKIAQAYIAQLNEMRAFSVPIVTQIEALDGFYPAEDYHQDYMMSHPYQDYIVYFDLPKLANLKRLFPEIYNPIPVTVKVSAERDLATPEIDKKI